MKSVLNRELDYLRVGHLTYAILLAVKGLFRSGRAPYYALILEELEPRRRLGAGTSLIYNRLEYLARNGFLQVKRGASANPKAKKAVRCFLLTDRGQELLEQLEAERRRLGACLKAFV